MTAGAEVDRCPLCPSWPPDPLLVWPERDRRTFGAWCPSCSLPSAVAIVVAARCRHGWPTFDLSPIVACLECGRIVEAPTRQQPARDDE